MRRKRREKTPEPVCGCRHNLAFHDPETGRCNHTEQIILRNEEVVRHPSGNVVKSPYGELETIVVQTFAGERRCGCVRYTGPEPLTQYYAPEIIVPQEGGG